VATADPSHPVKAGRTERLAARRERGAAARANRRQRAAARRERAAAVADEALRGGLVAAAIAAVAWILAGILTGTIFAVLLVATLVVAGITVVGRRVSSALWIGLALGWAVVLIERWAVYGHGGVWVAAAAWVGVVAGARRAGISRWALPLLAYPLISGAIALAAGQSLLHPWGVSWLWVAAVLGPPVGARVLLRPRSTG
jgi:hypothetical protein